MSASPKLWCPFQRSDVYCGKGCALFVVAIAEREGQYGIGRCSHLSEGNGLPICACGNVRRSVTEPCDPTCIKHWAKREV